LVFVLFCFVFLSFSVVCNLKLANTFLENQTDIIMYEDRDINSNSIDYVILISFYMKNQLQFLDLNCIIY